MEEKNKNEELKQQVTNEASPVARASYSTGTGMGPNDCMSQDFFNSLNDRGAISGTIYVCGYGWITAGSSASGCGCGSGCGSIPSCICGCCSYDLCSCISTGCGSGCGSGSGSGCGCGSSISHSCACSCYYCGTTGSASGSASGSIDDNYRRLVEARKFKNVRNDNKVMEAIEAVWREMVNSARNNERREAGCYIYYRPYDGKYYIGDIKFGRVVSGDTQASMYLGSSSPTSNGVPKDAICITSCHAHTAFLKGSSEQERLVGPSPTDINDLKNSGMYDGDYRIVLDYEGHFVENNKYYIFPGHNVYDRKQMYIHYNNKKDVSSFGFGN